MPYANEFREGQKFSIDDYHEVYRRVAPGKLLATSTRNYRINDEAHQFIWNQTIEFNECFDAVEAVDKADSRLSVTRNFVVYDSR
jgi:hypothetical protein